MDILEEASWMDAHF